jgi:large subunit ribosomal protein L21e|tara:strand:+ start:421 stop:723 length:303 start_codon:yes stop_codon:yes gene_type:complete
MTSRIGGSRRKTRSKFRKNIRTKGKISTVNFFQKFSPGDQVILKAETSVHKGLYHARFHSKVGRVLKSRGDCFEVEIKDGNKPKTLVVHPVHLKKCQTQK